MKPRRFRLHLRLTLLFVPLLLAIGTGLAPPPAHAEQVSGTLTVGNNPWGIAYDSGAGELFVADSGSGRTVSVVCDGTNTNICSTGENTLAATITLPSGSTEPTGITYDSGKGEIFVANQGGGTVSVICDGTNSNCGSQNAVAATIGPAVSGLSCSSTCGGLYVANGLVYDPSTSDVYVTTGDCVSSDCYVYVISDGTNTVTGAIAIGSSPGYAAGLAYDSGAGEIFVPIYGSGKVAVICDGTTSICNTGANTLAATIALPSGSQPEAIAYDSAKGEIFVENYGGTVLVYCDGTNSASCSTPDTLVATISFGSALNPGIAYDSRTGEIFLSVLSYYVSVISDSTNSITGTMYVGLGPYGIAYDSGAREALAAVTDSNAVAVIPDPTLVPSHTSVSSGGSITLSGSSYLSGTPVEDASCATYGGYIYCVGAFAGSIYSSAVYYAQLSSAGVGQWLNTTSYPTNIFATSCSINSGYIYCVGGYTGTGYSSGVYYAQVSSGGVGTWQSGTSYPTNVDLESCTIYSNSSAYIYCVGGYTGSSYTSATYYAQVTSGGVGAWSTGTAYPSALYGESCDVSGSNIFCVGGYTGATYVSSVYYSSLSSGGGTGSWASTTAYPTNIYVEGCAVASGYVYCVDGYTGSAYTSAVYFAQLTSTGIPASGSPGTWTSTTAYPSTIDRTSCGTSSGYIYCVGGNYGGQLSSGVYYAQVSSSGAASWATSYAYASRAYYYCFESGITSSPTSCPPTKAFTPSPAGGIPASTTLTVTGTTGLAVVSDAITHAVLSSALVTLFADPTVAVTPAGPFSFDAGQTASTLTAAITYSGPDTTAVEWYSSSTAACSSSSTDTHTSGATLIPSTSSPGVSYYCAVVSDSGVPGYAYASNAVKVTVLADPTVAVTPAGPLSFDVGQTASQLSASVTYSGPNTASVEWYSSASSTCSAGSSDTGTSGTSLIPRTSSAGTTYYCAAVTDSGVAGYSYASNAVVVAVDPSLSAGTASATINPVDQGQATTVSTTGASGGSGSYTYAWSGLPAGCSSTSSSFSCSPTSSSVNPFTVMLTVTDGNGQTATASFHLTVDPALSAGTISASSNPANVGQQITISTTGASGGSGTGTYSYAWAHLPDGCSTADSSSISCTPTDTTGSPFSVSLVVTDANSNAATASFTLTVRLSTAALTLSQTSGPVGDVVSVSGTGFSPSSLIASLKFDGVSEPTSPSPVLTSATGSFTASMTIPASAAGSHTVTASDGIDTGSASFTVLPSVTLAPGGGQLGTVVTAVGTGFAASNTLSATFGGASVSLSGTTSTDTSGSASVSFVVPRVPQGATTFTLTDASGDVASSTFTVVTGTVVTTTSVSCTPSAPVGGAATVCTATVTGSSPTGTVTFSSASGLFSPAATCAVVTSGTLEGSCYVEFVSPTASGRQTVTASYSGDQVNAPSAGTFGLSVVSLGSLSLSVSCSPSVGVGASDTCTATVTPSTASGDVNFVVSSADVMLSLPECTLSSGACTVSAIGAAAGSASLTATFVGESSTMALSVVPPPSNSVAQAASFAAISASPGSGGSAALTSFNGICDGVSLANTGAPAGTQVGALCQSLSGPSAGVPAPGIVTAGGYSVTYYDVLVSGVDSGVATVCLPDTGATSGSTMDYYVLPGGPWSTATGIEVPPASAANTVCGEIPVDELVGTNLLIGNPTPRQVGGILPTTTLVTCPSPTVTIGSLLTCTVSVTSASGSPTGSVAFSSSPVSSDLNLEATCSLAAVSGTSAGCSIVLQPAPGAAYSPYLVTASYSGDSFHSGSSGSVMLSVLDPTSTTIVCSPSEVVVGSSTTCTVTVEDVSSPSSIPTAFVLLSGPSSLGAQVNSGCTLNSSGVCVVSLIPDSPGNFTISGEYIGDTTHAWSQGSATIVGAAAPSVTTTTTTTTTTSVSSTSTFTTTSATSASVTSTTVSTTTAASRTSTQTPTTSQTQATYTTTTSSTSSPSSTTTLPPPPATTTQTSTTLSTSTPTTVAPSSFPYVVLGVVLVVAVSVGVAVWRRRVATEYAKHPPVEL